MKLGIIGFLCGVVLALSACAPQKFLSALNPQYTAQEPCGFVQNVYGERISWKGKLPIQLQIHESVPAEYYPAVEETLRSWEAATGKKIFEVVSWGSRGPNQPRQDGVNTIYYLNTWEDAKSLEQARTSVYWIGDQIREADIRLNAKDFTFYVDTSDRQRSVHMASLLIHEFGHVLGLKHQDGVASVMGTYLSSNTVRSSISETDMASIRCEY
jgi:hypothetical protein